MEDLKSLRRRIGRPLRIHQPQIAELSGTLTMLTIELLDDPENESDGIVTFRIELEDGSTWTACTNLAMQEVGTFMSGHGPFRTDAHTPILLDWGDTPRTDAPLLGRRSRQSPLAG